MSAGFRLAVLLCFLAIPVSAAAAHREFDEPGGTCEEAGLKTPERAVWPRMLPERQPLTLSAMASFVVSSDTKASWSALAQAEASPVNRVWVGVEGRYASTFVSNMSTHALLSAQALGGFVLSSSYRTQPVTSNIILDRWVEQGIETTKYLSGNSGCGVRRDEWIVVGGLRHWRLLRDVPPDVKPQTPDAFNLLQAGVRWQYAANIIDRRSFVTVLAALDPTGGGFNAFASWRQTGVGGGLFYGLEAGLGGTVGLFLGFDAGWTFEL